MNQIPLLKACPFFDKSKGLRNTFVFLCDSSWRRGGVGGREAITCPSLIAECSLIWSCYLLDESVSQFTPPWTRNMDCYILICLCIAPTLPVPPLILLTKPIQVSVPSTAILVNPELPPWNSLYTGRNYKKRWSTKKWIFSRLPTYGKASWNAWPHELYTVSSYQIELLMLRLQPVAISISQRIVEWHWHGSIYFPIYFLRCFFQGFLVKIPVFATVWCYIASNSCQFCFRSKSLDN